MSADTPITDLVNLCRKYTREQWAEASFRAAMPWVDEVCNTLARHAPPAETSGTFCEATPC